MPRLEFIRPHLIATVLILSILGCGLEPPLASASYEITDEPYYRNSLRFTPAFPTDKSNITAHIPIFYPNLCSSATLEGFEVNNSTIDVKVTHYYSGGPGIGCLMAEYNPIFQANLGHLDTGEYKARLMINGSEVFSRTLMVSSGDLEIVSTGRYGDRDERSHIIGEIRNVGTQPVGNVSALLSFYDQDRIQVATDYAFPTLNVLSPNQSSGFDYIVTFVQGPIEIRINHYDIIDIAKNADLEVTMTTKKFLQPYGDAFISGNVTNKSDTVSSNQTIVTCTLYDRSKTRVIDTIVNQTLPAKIEPGETAQFVIYSNYHPVDSSYSATCSAGEETLGTRVIPEFGSSYLIIAVLLTVISGIFISLRLFRTLLPSGSS